MEDFQIKRLGKFRQRIVVSALGFIFVGGTFYWTGELCSYVTILEEKVKWRNSYLNEWDYRIYWSYWQYKYELIKIL